MLPQSCKTIASFPETSKIRRTKKTSVNFVHKETWDGFRFTKKAMGRKCRFALFFPVFPSTRKVLKRTEAGSALFLALVSQVVQNPPRCNIAFKISNYFIITRPLKFIEDYIRDYVYPFYANTHTTTSVTSRQTTKFRHEAR